MTQDNESYHYAMKCFTKACLKRIGIDPLDDDRLILKAAVDFGVYIKTFKSLDHSVEWQQRFIDTMVKAKIDALSKRINKEYESHQRYIDMMHFLI